MIFMQLAQFGRRVATGAMFLASLISTGMASAQSSLTVLDVASDKARYAPAENIRLRITTENQSKLASVKVSVSLESLGQVVHVEKRDLPMTCKGLCPLTVEFAAPGPDFQGYRADVRIFDENEQLIAQGAGAIDISSDWNRFPRYGYVANYEKGTPVESWLEQLNRYHLNGVQFYDVQYKHHLPLPQGDAVPESWLDVAGRTINRDVVLSMIQEAKRHNMKTMAYNASYAAYADAFTDGSGVKLPWAAWPDEKGVRVTETVKAYTMPQGWATPKLLYMNQANPEWREYLFSRMNELFRRLPFDGWHTDTYGDAEAWSWDRKRINFVSGFPKFADDAHAATGKPVVLNTVSGMGEAAMANSAAEFVYSELWPDDHATYASILRAADEIHAVGPDRAVVFAGYMNNALAEDLAKKGKLGSFNPPGIFLTDAVMFAAGASHIELGDGDRMLSRPYFVDDEVLKLSDESRARLRNYYDFLVAYENHLRDGVHTADFEVRVNGLRQSKRGEAGAVWTITREKGAESIIHLINLTTVHSDLWRDDKAEIGEPTTLRNVHLEIGSGNEPRSAGWTSPDIDQGAWHQLTPHRAENGAWEIVVPELKYWTVVILNHNQDRP